MPLESICLSRHTHTHTHRHTPGRTYTRVFAHIGPTQEFETVWANLEKALAKTVMAAIDTFQYRSCSCWLFQQIVQKKGDSLGVKSGKRDTMSVNYAKIRLAKLLISLV